VPPVLVVLLLVALLFIVLAAAGKGPIWPAVLMLWLVLALERWPK
jgi:hypothetical protein